MTWLTLRGSLRAHLGFNATAFSVRDVFQFVWTPEKRTEWLRNLVDEIFLPNATWFDPDSLPAGELQAAAQLESEAELAAAINGWLLGTGLFGGDHGAKLAGAWGEQVAGLFFPKVRKVLPDLSLRERLTFPFWVDGWNMCEGAAPLWNAVSYDFQQIWSTIVVRIHFDFDDDVPIAIRTPLRSFWRYCVETWWSGRFAVAFGDELPCPIELRLVFGDADHDWDVDVEDPKRGVLDSVQAWFLENDRSDVLSWYWSPEALSDPEVGIGFSAFWWYALTPPHEVGHMLGLRDEYGNPWFCGTDNAFLKSIITDNRLPLDCMGETFTFQQETIMRSLHPGAVFPARYFASVASRIGCSLSGVGIGLPGFDLADAVAGTLLRRNAVLNAM
ncbi:MAG: hypothetical protein H6747_09685 [Deltaproteobacteria bacterium]|nr:hypothetical protein [Deltaproteobacteria bacterium]